MPLFCRVCALLLVPALLGAQVRLSLAMNDPQLSQRLFGRWASGHQSMWSGVVTNVGSSPVVVTEAVLGGAMLSADLRWTEQRLIERAVSERAKTNPSTLGATLLRNGALGTLLARALEIFPMTKAAVAGVGAAAALGPTVGNLIAGASPASVDNLRALNWTAFVLEPGESRAVVLWTSRYELTRWTYVMQIGPESLPAAGVMKTLGQMRDREGLTLDTASRNMLALMGVEAVIGK